MKNYLMVLGLLFTGAASAGQGFDEQMIMAASVESVVVDDLGNYHYFVKSENNSSVEIVVPAAFIQKINTDKSMLKIYKQLNNILFAGALVASGFSMYLTIFSFYLMYVSYYSTCEIEKELEKLENRI